MTGRAQALIQAVLSPWGDPCWSSPASSFRHFRVDCAVFMKEDDRDQGSEDVKTT